VRYDKDGGKKNWGRPVCSLGRGERGGRRAAGAGGKQILKKNKPLSRLSGGEEKGKKKKGEAVNRVPEGRAGVREGAYSFNIGKREGKTERDFT